MNEFFTGFNAPGGLGQQVYPILGAVVIFVIGWIAALMISGGTKALLHKLMLNEKINQHRSVQSKHFDIEQIIARIVFWFIFIIAIVAGLNALNLQVVGAPFAGMVGQVLVFIPVLISAAIIALVGWLVATIVRRVMVQLLSRTTLDERLSQQVGVTGVTENIADIVYWFILLLFVPMVLSVLGLSGLLEPIQVMLTQMLAYIPNLVMAGVVLVIGYVLAKIVRGLVEGFISSVGVQSQVQKLGVRQNVGVLLGKFVFAMIMLTSLIVAFDTLGVEAISRPATNMLNQIMLAIPNIFAAAIILIIAYVVSRFVAQLVTGVLESTGIDEVPAKINLQQFLGRMRVSQLIGWLIVFFTMLFATAEAANRLGFDQVNDIIATFIEFAGNIILGTVIMAIGFWLANIAASIIARGEYKSASWLSAIVRVLIMGLVLAMGLKAMGIADSIVNLAFGLTLGSAAVAFALAFGLGGRAPAERVLNQLLDKAEQEAKKKAAVAEVTPRLPLHTDDHPLDDRPLGDNPLDPKPTDPNSL